MRHVLRRLAPLAALCTGFGSVAVALAPAASAETITQVFSYTGAEQTFDIPAGIGSVHVVAVGGRGGDAGTLSGGAGATVVADLDVSGVTRLHVEVGGNGQDGQPGNSAAGGFNGGATGGNGGAGAGGGASDVRTDSGSLVSRLLVAGGGGGAAGGGGGGAGEGTGTGGRNGSPGGETSSCQAGGGGGGDQSTGGTAGTGFNPIADGRPGQQGAGGPGGDISAATAAAGGGGGGGGLFGGGGGAAGLDCGGGGGGGSSFVDATRGSSASVGADGTGTPRITISYVVPEAPQAVTEPASDVDYGSVTLNGVVNPEGAATTYQFEIRNTGTTAWHLVGSPFPAGSGSTQVAEQYIYTGVVPATPYEYQLVTTNSVGETDGGVQRFTTLGGPPVVTTEPASDVGQTTATLNGVLNPNGLNALYWFDYGTSPSYGTQTGQGGEGGTSQVAVQMALTGLTPGTTYYVRLHASNLAGTTFDGGLTFTTLPAPAAPAPTCTTRAATKVGQHGATLNGSVNPHGAAATYHFEYGTTTAYGHSTASVSAGSGTSAKAVHALLSGLPRHTTFHFRLVAVSANGTTNGLDKTFRTT